MDPLGWLKTNLIVILAVALGVSILGGLAGTWWFKNAYEKADLARQVAEANLAGCKTANDALTGSVQRQNDAIAALEKATSDNKALAETLAAAAAKAAQPAKDLAAALHNVKRLGPTAAEPCRDEHALIDKFFAGKVKP